MVPSEKRQKTNTGTTKNQKHDIVIKIAYSPQKAQIRHTPKAKIKLWIVIFVFLQKTIDKTLYSIDNISSFHILLHSIVAVVWKAYMA